MRAATLLLFVGSAAAGTEGPVPSPPTASPTTTTDPTCALGILAARGTVCCPSSCGSCGGNGCALRQGGAAACCISGVRSGGRKCDTTVAPCTLDVPGGTGFPSRSPQPPTGFPSRYPRPPTGWPVRTGFPWTGFPSSGFPTQSTGYPGFTGYPSTGFPSTGFPSSGFPSTGFPSSSVSAGTWVKSSASQRCARGNCARQLFSLTVSRPSGMGPVAGSVEECQRMCLMQWAEGCRHINFNPSSTWCQLLQPGCSIDATCADGEYWTYATATGAPTVGTGAPSVGTGAPSVGTGAPSVGTGAPTAATGAPTAATGAPVAGTSPTFAPVSSFPSRAPDGTHSPSTIASAAAPVELSTVSFTLAALVGQPLPGLPASISDLTVSSFTGPTQDSSGDITFSISLQGSASSLTASELLALRQALADLLGVELWRIPEDLLIVDPGSIILTATLVNPPYPPRSTKCTFQERKRHRLNTCVGGGGLTCNRFYVDSQAAMYACCASLECGGITANRRNGWTVWELRVGPTPISSGIFYEHSFVKGAAPAPDTASPTVAAPPPSTTGGWTLLGNKVCSSGSCSSQLTQLWVPRPGGVYSGAAGSLANCQNWCMRQEAAGCRAINYYPTSTGWCQLLRAGCAIGNDCGGGAFWSYTPVATAAPSPSAATTVEPSPAVVAGGACTVEGSLTNAVFSNGAWDNLHLASNCIDRNANELSGSRQVAPPCASRSGSGVWLRVQMVEEGSSVCRVRITPRQDCCWSRIGNHEIWVGNNANSAVVDNVKCSQMYYNQKAPFDHVISNPACRGKYLFLYRPGPTDLSLNLNEIGVHYSTVTATDAPTMAPTPVTVSPTTPAPTAFCRMGDRVVGQYVPSCSLSCRAFDSLPEAQAACCAEPTCNGVTQQFDVNAGKYQLRAGTTTIASAITPALRSWLKTSESWPVCTTQGSLTNAGFSNGALSFFLRASNCIDNDPNELSTTFQPAPPCASLPGTNVHFRVEMNATGRTVCKVRITPRQDAHWHRLGLHEIWAGDDFAGGPGSVNNVKCSVMTWSQTSAAGRAQFDHVIENTACTGQYLWLYKPGPTDVSLNFNEIEVFYSGLAQPTTSPTVSPIGACAAWGCTCQGFSDYWGTGAGRTWGCADNAPASKDWWEGMYCTTAPSGDAEVFEGCPVADCGEWGCSCQGFSDYFGTRIGITFNCALTAETQGWWHLLKCISVPGSAGPYPGCPGEHVIVGDRACSGGNCAAQLTSHSVPRPGGAHPNSKTYERCVGWCHQQHDLGCRHVNFFPGANWCQLLADGCVIDDTCDPGNYTNFVPAGSTLAPTTATAAPVPDLGQGVCPSGYVQRVQREQLRAGWSCCSALGCPRHGAPAFTLWCTTGCICGCIPGPPITSAPQPATPAPTAIETIVCAGRTIEKVQRAECDSLCQGTLECQTMASCSSAPHTWTNYQGRWYCELDAPDNCGAETNHCSGSFEVWRLPAAAGDPQTPQPTAATPMPTAATVAPTAGIFLRIALRGCLSGNCQNYFVASHIAPSLTQQTLQSCEARCVATVSPRKCMAFNFAWGIGFCQLLAHENCPVDNTCADLESVQYYAFRTLPLR